MAKILSIIMAVVMLVMTSIIPGFVMPGTDAVETGEWLEKVDVAFGMASGDDFDAVAIAAEWGVLVDYDIADIDVDAPVTDDFVATTLVNAANLTATEDELAAVKIKNADALPTYDKVAVAVAKGVISTNVLGMVSTGAMDSADCDAALAAALALWQNKSFDSDSACDINYVDGVKVIDTAYTEADGVLTFDADTDLVAGDVFVAGDAAYVAEGVDGNVVSASSVDVQEVVDTVDYEGSVTPDLTLAAIEDGAGEIVSDGFNIKEAIREADLITKLANISFSVKGFKVKAKVTDTGLYFNIAKSLAGGNVTVSKSYDLSNLVLNTKFDASLKSLKFNEVYITSTYDLVDTTTISGSYAASLVEKELGEGADAVSFLDRVKGGLFTVAEGSTKIQIAKFDIPLGSTPLTVTLDFSVIIGVDGTMKLVVTSENTTGYEIINNKGRLIHEEEVIDREINAYGNFSITLGFGVGLGILGYNVVDVAVQGGLGANVYATLKFLDAEGNVITESTAKVAVDAVSAAVASSDLDVDTDLQGEVNLYGILKVSVGQNSIIKKIGLSKTWTIFDQNNGVFYTYTFNA